MGEMNMSDMISRVLVQYPAFLFALSFHEFAHGWVARKSGDRTAEMMGRLTLNPMSHADPIGTVILPILGMASGGFMFGWAKPVPVNERNLKKPRQEMFWIALAGPVSNLLLAMVAVFGLAFADRYGGGLRGAGHELLVAFFFINLFLAVFNLIPVHPLDGGKVLARFLPDNVNNWLEGNQQIIGILFLGLMLTGAFRVLAYPVNLLAGAMLAMAQSIALLFPA
jgi:Zn-dependent protease